MQPPTDPGADPSKPSSPSGSLCAPWWRPSWLCAGRPSRSQDGCDGNFLMTPPCRSRTKRSTSRSTTVAGARRPTAASRSHAAAEVRQAHAPSEACPPSHGPGDHPQHGAHHRPPCPDRGPQGPRPLGGRPRDGHPAFGSRHAGRTHQPLHDHRRAAGRHKAEQVTPHLTTSLLNIPPQLRRTLTWGRAREIAEHQAISAVTGCRSTSASHGALGNAAPRHTPPAETVPTCAATGSAAPSPTRPIKRPTTGSTAPAAAGRRTSTPAQGRPPPIHQHAVRVLGEHRGPPSRLAQ